MVNTQEEAVLVVDDDENFLECFAALLETHNIRTLVATSGEEGLRKLKEGRVGVVVSDQRMPGMSGTDFLTTVSQNYPTVVRILISGYTDFQPTIEAFNKAGAKNFISKTAETQDKIRIIEEGRKFRKELLELEDARKRRRQQPVPRELPDHPKILLVVRDSTGYGTFFTLVRNMQYPIRAMKPDSFRNYQYNANDYHVIFVDADQMSVDEIPVKSKELATYPYIVLIASDPAPLRPKVKEKGIYDCIPREKLSYASSIGDYLLDLPFIGTKVFNKPV